MPTGWSALHTYMHDHALHMSECVLVTSCYSPCCTWLISVAIVRVVGAASLVAVAFRECVCMHFSALWLYLFTLL